MIFQDVLRATNLSTFNDDDAASVAIADALRAINDTPTGGQMLEQYILANLTYPGERVIEIRFTPNDIRSFNGTGVVNLDPYLVSSIVYINHSGVVVQDTVEGVLAHELVHALLGLTDAWEHDPDYSGDTVTYANQIFSELGLDQQLSYPGAGSPNILDVSRDYSLGNDIDRAFVSSLTPSDHSAVGFFRDLMIGDSAGNELNSGSSNDIVYGEAGADTLRGGQGDDTLFGGTGNDAIEGGNDDDVIYGGAGSDSIDGGSGNDTINGEIGADSINAGAGNDTVFGGDDDDTINGGDGGDSLAGDDGNDFIEGGTGTDTIYGGAGTDNINAGTGNDIVYGGTANDIINGSEGNDVLSGGSGADVISGGSGADIVRFTGATSGISASFTSGGSGSGTGGDASGDTYSDIEGIIGTANNDTFTATSGGVVLAGGAGIDTFNITYQSSGTPYVIWGGAGVDVYNFDLGDADPESTILGIVGVNVANLTEHNFHLFSLSNSALYRDIPQKHVDIIILNPDDHESIAGMNLFNTPNDYPTITLPNIFGTSGNDSLDGSSANDVISGGAGNDFIKSGAGNDTIIYTSGNDTIAGFTQNYGFDTVDLRGFAAADVSFRISGVNVIATTADGEITLANQVSYDVGHQRSNIEEIMLSDGTLDDAGIRARAIADQSTSGDDVITATKHDDVISSAAGNDTITASSGDDTIIYTSGDDVIAGNKWNKGNDTLDLRNYTAMDVSFSISGDDILITTTDGVITLAQQLFNELGHLNSNIEQITFSDSTLDDAGIRNRAVADQSAGADGIVTGTAGNDNINAAFVDADSDAINDLGQTINAGSGSDLIYDGAGDDFVFGGDGNDRFYSGLGADAFDGGAGSDRVFYTGSNVGVTVDLTDTSQSTGIAQGDSYSSIAQIDGSNHNDTIIMDGSIQKAHAGAGDDRLVDMGGATHLWGAAGADTFELHIGSGTSNIRDFSGSSGQGDQIDLTGWNVDAIDATNFSIERRFGTTSSKYDQDAILIVTDGQGSELDRTVVNGVTWDTAGGHSLTFDDFLFV